MNVFLEVTHVLMLTVSILMEASVAHLVILVSLVMECLVVSFYINLTLGTHAHAPCLEYMIYDIM